MTTPATDGKMLANALYHSAVVSGLAMGYAKLGKMIIGGSTPKLDLTARDVGIVVVDVALAMATKDMLVKQGILPADILK
jgi:phosphoribosylaminoimidazole (AIR) synthetase